MIIAEYILVLNLNELFFNISMKPEDGGISIEKINLQNVFLVLPNKKQNVIFRENLSNGAHAPSCLLNSMVNYVLITAYTFRNIFH